VHPVLKKFAKKFNLLQIHEDSDILCIYFIDEEDTTLEGKQKMIIPLSLIIPIFYKAHYESLAGHHGIKKTIESIQTIYYFPGLYPWISALIKDCLLCQQHKHMKKQIASLHSPSRQVTSPFHTIHIDFKGPINPPSNGYKYILVIVDTFSRYIQAMPTKDCSSKTAIEYLLAYIYIYRFGIPNYIVSDRGSHFLNKDFMHTCTNLDIQLKYLSGFNPQANGTVENVVMLFVFSYVYVVDTINNL